jgi:hypothetical protein
MEAEGYGRRCGGWYICRCSIPTLAHDAETRCLVSECWHDGFAGSFLRHVDFPSYPILRHSLCCSSWSLVVPELV